MRGSRDESLFTEFSEMFGIFLVTNTILAANTRYSQNLPSGNPGTFQSAKCGETPLVIKAQWYAS